MNIIMKTILPCCNCGNSQLENKKAAVFFNLKETSDIMQSPEQILVCGWGALVHERRSADVCGELETDLHVVQLQEVVEET